MVEVSFAFIDQFRPPGLMLGVQTRCVAIIYRTGAKTASLALY